ncbi:hypothetical protein IV203_023628 [Nitzschia inconspicua]|uniref:Transmembrane protein n=1 Tax=Nitzschia inconspicua TaxID=303405 RepID=A0A9K3KDK4_9STRA|nr:hypothetical protein IV203_023628 [Nitzschia inconspicua]
MSMCQTSLLMSTKSQSSTESADAPKTRNKILVVGKRKIRPVTLNHERDFFRQAARLESMDSYLLVSTLTASMSFGALLGFSPVIRAVEVAAMSSFRAVWYNSICSAIPVVAGFSAIFGLYATVMFSLTVLYGKSALGSERDLPYDKFLRRTVRCRVHGARCFNLSLGFFAFEAFLVMLERTFNRPWFVGVLATTVGTLWYLFRDWRLIFRMAEYIYKD